jgi:hypothetical protein
VLVQLPRGRYQTIEVQDQNGEVQARGGLGGAPAPAAVAAPVPAAVPEPVPAPATEPVPAPAR